MAARKLRAVPPTQVEKYLKLLIYGGAGTGKTHTLCQFPQSYFFDLEKGAEEKQYRDMLKKSGSLIYSTIDIDELIDEVTTLLSVPHEFKTVVVDPITSVFNDEADLAEDRVGSDYGKNVAEATKKWRRLGKLLKRLQMTVVVSAYEKKKFGDADAMVPAGPKDMEHFFDVVLRTERRGDTRYANVVKSRNQAFPEGSAFPFTFEEIAMRYGRENLERASVPVPLATPEQVGELERLLATRVDGDELRDKWLKKANADRLSELPAEAAEKCVTFLKGGDEKKAETEAA